MPKSVIKEKCLKEKEIMFGDVDEIPLVLHSTNNDKAFIRENAIGCGKFGKCYQIRQVNTNARFAVKIVSKNYKKWQRIQDEISINKLLNHKNIVKFYEFSEDSKFVYVFLELCSNRTLHDFLRLRLKVSNPEFRFYIKQILEGLRYLHEDMMIIHGDLKLSNILLNDNLVIKICDFGFAAKLKHRGEQKRPRGGTAGFSAPEIVCVKPVSFPADIWSIGCIMYCMLVGRKPFKSATKSETRKKVCQCDYYVPSTLNKSASELIVLTLWPDPNYRPNVSQIINYPFINGRCPDRRTMISLYKSSGFRRSKNNSFEKIIKTKNHVQSKDNEIIKV